MPYELVTPGQLTGMLQTRLNGSGFWTTTELQEYINEALRTWQAMSQAYTTRVSFATVPNQLFYNLYSVVSSLAPSITDQDVIKQIQRHLQEPVTGNSWTGTEQFNLQTIVNAIQQARDKFFIETGLGITEVTVGTSGPPSGSVELPEHVIDVRRAMWLDANGVYYTLWRADQFDLTAGFPDWFIAPGLPQDYSTVLQQPLMLQLSPPPIDAGTLDLLVTESGGILNPTISPSVLGIPDDFIWVVKYGALASIFAQEGPGQDMARSQYCQQRWNDGISLARIANFVRFGYQDGIPRFVSSMEELDQAQPTWVQNLPGIPSSLAISGNILACSPISDNQPHSIALDICPNFPVASSYVQVGNEIIEAIVDYAQHVAYTKEGAEELRGSIGMYQALLKLAAVQNDRLRAASNNFDALSDRTVREEKFTKRRNSDIGLKELGSE